MDISFSDIKKITLEKVQIPSFKHARDKKYLVIVIEEFSGERHEINIFGDFIIANYNLEKDYDGSEALNWHGDRPTPKEFYPPHLGGEDEDERGNKRNID